LAKRLGAVGVSTLERLGELGALAVWAKIADQTPEPERVHTLLALEGAIRGERWTTIDRREREAILAAAGLGPASAAASPGAQATRKSTER